MYPFAPMHLLIKSFFFSALEQLQLDGLPDAINDGYIGLTGNYPAHVSDTVVYPLKH